MKHSIFDLFIDEIYKRMKENNEPYSTEDGYFKVVEDEEKYVK